MREKHEELVREMIIAIGDDPDREGLKDTPARVVKSWQELYQGYGDSSDRHSKVFTSECDQIVSLRNVDFFSTCEHHVLPFFGKCHVAYLPGEEGKVLGVSKIARIIGVHSRRLQIQEKMTQDIAESIREAVSAAGVAVIADGLHLCMMLRGVRQQHARMRTSCMLGVFREATATRAEVMQLLLSE